MWRQVTEPIGRSEAVRQVAAQWRFGRRARAEPHGDHPRPANEQPAAVTRIYQ